LEVALEVGDMDKNYNPKVHSVKFCRGMDEMHQSISREIKSLKFWKELQATYIIIREYLCWKVGNGSSMRIAIDLWVGNMLNTKFQLSYWRISQQETSPPYLT
jgi:hypothetical protein